MKPIMIVGIVLIVLGIAGMIFQGVTYTTREPVVDVPGVVKVTSERQKTIPIPLILGAIALVGGIAIVVAASKRPA